MNKKALSESDICDRYITPALERAGWDKQHWRREYGFTDGKIIVRGQARRPRQAQARRLPPLPHAEPADRR